MTTPARADARSWVSLSVETQDRHRYITVVSSIGLIAAAALALFGLPAVDLHGPLHHLGIMGPTCGATRAAWYTLHGRLDRAWAYNPAGIVALVGAGLAGLRTVVGVTVSRWVTWTVTSTPWKRRALYLLGVAALVVLEVRQQSRATLLMGP